MGAFIVDAWIDSIEPSIRLLNRSTGKLIAQWQDQEARRLIEDGVVTVAELSSGDRAVNQRVAQELLLTACADSFCGETKGRCFSCVTRRLLRSYRLLSTESILPLPGHGVA
ncbi:hypothetical protein [Marinobacterium jannaschii]|uniref:hypothetical protein n=1 Tax=Marinobacterium jannaschii TaxID=64970 RepID=UPI000B1BEDC8|nr:hypothetical protein [Marinobacterium jannaschii]